MSRTSRKRRRELGLKCRAELHRVKDVMGIPQEIEMTHEEIGESVPPRYAEFIAREAIRQMKGDR